MRGLQSSSSSSSSEEEPDHSRDWSALFVFCAIFFVVLLWVVPAVVRRIYLCCRRQSNATSQQTRDEARQQAVEEAFERMLHTTEAEFVRAILGQGAESNHSTQASRKSYIERVLMREKYRDYKLRMATKASTQSGSNEDVENDVRQPSVRSIPQRALSESSSSQVIAEPPAASSARFTIVPDNDDDDPNGGETCAICLSPYEDDDEVAWSHNDNCQHVFHRECIAEWLQKKEECPFCRNFFLHFGDEEETGVPRETHVPVSSSTTADDPDGRSVLDVFRDMGRLYRMMQIAERNERELEAVSGGTQAAGTNADPIQPLQPQQQVAAPPPQPPIGARTPPRIMLGRHHRIARSNIGARIARSTQETSAGGASGNDSNAPTLLVDVRTPPGSRGNVTADDAL